MSKKNFKNPALNFISQESIEKVEVEDAPIKEVEPAEIPKGYKADPRFIELKSRRVQFLLQPSVHDGIKKIAKKEKTSVNDYVNTLLKNHVESREG
ncbi:MAG: hypothetical protein WAO49_01785 [Arcanobacterium sp.]